MGKLIVSSFVSLDGVVDKPWEWVGPFFDQEHKEDSLEKLKDIGLFLLSRPTYEHFSALWPNIKGEPYFDRMNELPKIVASKTLKDAGWNARVIEGHVIDEITRLKQTNDKDILKYGFGTLDRELMAHGLIDELQLCIIPVNVGPGRRIFEGMDAGLAELSMTGIRNFTNGAPILTYVPFIADKKL